MMLRTPTMGGAAGDNTAPMLAADDDPPFPMSFQAAIPWPCSTSSGIPLSRHSHDLVHDLARRL